VSAEPASSAHFPYRTTLDRDRRLREFRERGDMIPFGADRAFQSSPPVDVNAVACMHTIAAAARRLLLDNGGRIGPGWRLPDLLRGLVGLAGKLATSVVAEMAKAANGWRSEALTRCGWQTAIGGTRCPECRAPSGARGLRIRVDRESAYCVSCGTSWSAATMGILGRRIADEGDGKLPRAVRVQAVAALTLGAAVGWEWASALGTVISQAA
jgi:hypothetical protein